MKRAWLAITLVACGPSSTLLREARESSYQTELATVWNAVSAEMNEKFRDALKTEDASQGYVETKWKSVELVQDSTVGDSDMKANKTASGMGAREMWRMFVKIEAGGPPWRISVDGEAARYRPGLSVLTPYKHGDIDEPRWVDGRIDAVRLGIYDRLKQYAVAPAAAKTP